MQAATQTHKRSAVQAATQTHRDTGCADWIGRNLREGCEAPPPTFAEIISYKGHETQNEENSKTKSKT